MRLLAIMMSALGVLFTSPTFAKGDCDNTSTTTKDILQCATNLYEKVDKNLNEQYSKMVAPREFPNRKLLIETERAWVKYRDAYCNEIYESTLPGEEAEIEKMGCLISSTSSRLVELFRLDTGVSGDGFYNALSLINSISSKSRDEILLHIESLIKLPEETDYYKKNCELTQGVYGEDERLCRARLKFQSI
ncbi:lysozyme inhibitor LprI family protein [Pseudomonas veronii]|uniref:DUF1311 domain-containing protein n=1 Tax=Pseudomonas veronii TaxID=76761 RepID=A0A5M8EHA8_PSEVE|nr:lysozyme inhibitor LprI family protein [Pseudomonas veronii]KAA6170020.1 DUF1311 domain-containing protein [Pseudomonas veronii]KAA6172217.1 DUF1311 domain-containing protein [Pseudomonas veronii]